ncbi:MAG: hypothetical protein ACI8X3_001569 [Saprospiraceae bacterium]|jgi:hypothetical protein
MIRTDSSVPISSQFILLSPVTKNTDLTFPILTKVGIKEGAIHSSCFKKYGIYTFKGN